MCAFALVTLRNERRGGCVLQDAEKDKLAGLDETFEATPLEQLEKEFQEVVSELVGDQSLERFRLEYEKLHRALKQVR